MKRFITKTYKKWLAAVRKINLVDKCLILLMTVFLLQSGHNLFANHLDTSESNNIDVIVRTSSASIFGYFLSANFIKKRPMESDVRSTDTEIHSIDSPNQSDEIKNTIGFSMSFDNNIKESNNLQPNRLSQQEYIPDNHMQIIIATAIGTFSLMILLIVRNFTDITPETSTPSVLSTISQFRDFISGCVGFLIGSVKNDH